MNTKRMIFLTLSACFLLIVAGSCKKSNSTPPNGLEVLTNGSWQTTVWGGPNDTAIIAFSTSSGNTAAYMTYLGANAKAASKFSTGDAVFSVLTPNGDGTFSGTGFYRYTATGSSDVNGTVGYTPVMLTLQNNNTILFAHYSKDAVSGVTPPDYYWYNK